MAQGRKDDKQMSYANTVLYFLLFRNIPQLFHREFRIGNTLHNTQVRHQLGTFYIQMIIFYFQQNFSSTLSMVE